MPSFQGMDILNFLHVEVRFIRARAMPFLSVYILCIAASNCNYCNMNMDIPKKVLTINVTSFKVVEIVLICVNFITQLFYCHLTEFREANALIVY